MRQHRSAPVLALVLLACLVGVLAVAGPAQAASKKLKVSSAASGPFVDNLATPLFTGVYVPGSATSSFYVKNDSAQTARVTIALVDKVPANTFEGALSFTASAGGFASTVPVYVNSKKNRCRTLVTGPVLDGGQVQRVDVTMHIDPNLPTSAMNQSASFSFVVTLSQVTNKGKVDVCGDQSPGIAQVEVKGAQATSVSQTAPAASPNTAPETSLQPRSAEFVAELGLALAALGGGLLLLVRRRRPTRPGVR